MLFDTIMSIATPWYIEPHLLPISRKGVKSLKEWEELFLPDIDHCPYQGCGGRENAFWRIQVADYAGGGSMPDEDKAFFDAWCDRANWTPGHRKCKPKVELG
jgi:hypothetical protein